MGLESGKHTEKEIDETRCRVVETGITKERVDFLKPLLELNGLEVHVQELPQKVEDAPITFMLGVTDITFSAVLAVYEHKLLTADGRYVTPAYWNQLSDETKQAYWELNG
ncbi:MAG: hypothetical protein DRI71_07710 [Bacteroidetes bacterium]|nr:MAG: hypothetical protein DRI71_07710 [Bacteroidota bacterium]